MIANGLELSKADNILSRVTDPLISPKGDSSHLYDRVISDFGLLTKPQDTAGIEDLPIPNLVFDTGPSIVTGLRVYVATTCPGCDPVFYHLQGWDGEIKSWKTVATGPLDDDWIENEPAPPARNPKFASIVGSSSQNKLSSGFADFSTSKFFVPVVYPRYVLQFPTLRYGSDPSRLRAGELQLVGYVVE